MSVIKALTWDWKEQPDMEAISKAVSEVSGGTVYMREVDTGGDFYAWLVSDRELTDAEAEDAVFD